MTKRSRSNRERRQDSDARIIQAAIDLFASQGYQRTTLVQIGNLAGYTGTLISNRFGSKEKLLRAVLSYILNRFEDENSIDIPAERLASEGLGGSQTFVTDRLLQFVASYFRDVSDQEGRIRALYVIMGEALGSLPEIEDEIIRVNHVFRNQIQTFLAEGVRRGEFAAAFNIDAAALAIVGLLRGVAMQILTEPEQINIGETTAFMQKIVRAMVILEE
ncbi:MAG: TetR/AcrR family transcriptional regulator [Sneathiella sp.]